MHNITRRFGAKEVSRPDKIGNSSRTAGVGRESVAQNAVGIGHHKGITTSEVGNSVIGTMRTLEPDATGRYESSPIRAYEDAELSP